MIGDTLGISKDATTRVVYRVSKALCAMGLLERGLVLFSTSDAKGVSTMLLSHIKYRITHMFSPHCMRRSQMNRIVRNAVLYFFKKCISLPIRYGFIAIRLKGSPHQEVYEYSIITPSHTLPLKHMHKLDNLKVLKRLPDLLD